MSSIDLTAPSLEGTAIADLRERLAGDLALPGQPGYELATPWNVAVSARPGRS